MSQLCTQLLLVQLRSGGWFLKNYATVRTMRSRRVTVSLASEISLYSKINNLIPIWTPQRRSFLEIRRVLHDYLHSPLSPWSTRTAVATH